MGRKLYVGNLPLSADQQSLEKEFSVCGTVDTVNIIMDRDTGRSKGFAFIEMSRDSEAQKAIQEMNAKKIDGYEIVVNEAKPQAARGNGARRGPGGHPGPGSSRGNRW